MNNCSVLCMLSTCALHTEGAATGKSLIETRSRFATLQQCSRRMHRQQLSCPCQAQCSPICTLDRALLELYCWSVPSSSYPGACRRSWPLQCGQSPPRSAQARYKPKTTIDYININVLCVRGQWRGHYHFPEFASGCVEAQHLVASMWEIVLQSNMIACTRPLVSPGPPFWLHLGHATDVCTNKAHRLPRAVGTTPNQTKCSVLESDGSFRQSCNRPRRSPSKRGERLQGSMLRVRASMLLICGRVVGKLASLCACHGKA